MIYATLLATSLGISAPFGVYVLEKPLGRRVVGGCFFYFRCAEATGLS
jgi:hypothetical protein